MWNSIELEFVWNWRVDGGKKWIKEVEICDIIMRFRFLEMGMFRVTRGIYFSWRWRFREFKSLKYL